LLEIGIRPMAGFGAYSQMLCLQHYVDWVLTGPPQRRTETRFSYMLKVRFRNFT
jgi:hypothetical protein